ncbi:hypothetical protein Taro_023590, partial [Colocasia esculenta]|nr:hypothetical protein [Colocasia esculenta]
MAVSTTYGRVRKPVGFKFICSISDLLRVEDGECRPGVNNECCLWMPVAPPGYSAVGCVAHVGSQPPPNHIVYCIRSDLISSTAVSDCILSVPPNSRVPSGFSIWHIDNSVGSVFAHFSIDHPPKISCFDLHQIMLSNSDMHVPFKATSNDSVDQHNTSKQGKTGSSSTSGWDIVRSLQRTSSLSISTPHFERMWWDKGCEFCKPVSIWRPLPRPGFSILGDCIVEGLEPPALGLLFKYDNTGISARPEQFTKVAHIFRKGLDEAFVWYPIAPPGYVSLGCIITKTDEVPDRDSFCCPRMDLVNQANISEIPISRSSSSKGPNCWSIWKVEN